MELLINTVSQRIYLVRGFQVALDYDLAEFYQTKTKALNQAVRRNPDRFPSDFVIHLTPHEYGALLSHKVPAKSSANGVLKIEAGNSALKKREFLEVELIQSSVAQYYQVSTTQLRDATRISSIVRARHVCMYLIRKYLRFSYGRIGFILGGKDHTTVLHACRKIELDLAEGAELRKDLNEIQSVLEIKGIGPTVQISPHCNYGIQ